MKRKTAIIFMATGIMLIVAALSLLVYNNLENKAAREASDAVMDTIRTYIDESSASPTEKDPFDREMTIKMIDGYGYIGYLSVPSLDIDLPVMSEWDYERLKIAPCRYYGSTFTDNLVVAAHNYQSLFGYLGDIEKGDLVIFTDMDANVYNYKVDVIEILQPTDVEKVKDSGDDLILYTCTYGGAERITVRCSYVTEKKK